MWHICEAKDKSASMTVAITGPRGAGREQSMWVGSSRFKGSFEEMEVSRREESFLHIHYKPSPKNGKKLFQEG